MGTFINSTPVFAESVCVLRIVYSALAELSDKSKDIVGVLEVLLVNLTDLIIRLRRFLQY